MRAAGSLKFLVQRTPASVLLKGPKTQLFRVKEGAFGVGGLNQLLMGVLFCWTEEISAAPIQIEERCSIREKALTRERTQIEGKTQI